MRSCCCERRSRWDWPFMALGQRPKEGVVVRNGRAQRGPHARPYTLSVTHSEQSRVAVSRVRHSHAGGKGVAWTAGVRRVGCEAYGTLVIPGMGPASA